MLRGGGNDVPMRPSVFGCWAEIHNV